MTETVTSDRIERFRTAAATDPAAATRDLARELRDSGGPLVEPAGGEVVVTFVWIGPQRQVSVRGAQLFADRNALSHPMRRVGGTDVWHLSVRAPAGLTTVYQYLIDDPFLDVDHSDLALLGRLMVEARGRSYADPVNPRRLFPQAAIIAGEDRVPEEHWDSVLELPGLPPVDWFDGEPAGTLTRHRLDSTVLGNERTVTVQTPPGPPAGPYPLVVLLDGEAWLTVARLHVAIGKLIATGELPPVLVAYVHNPTADPMTTRMREMACEPTLTAMLVDELLPMLRGAYDVAPGPVTVGGTSLAGLAGAYAAYQRPDVFGAVLSCSGSHWWGYAPGGQGWGRDDEPEWLTRQLAAAPLAPVRWWIDVGVLETGASPLSPGIDQRAANRHLRTVLRAKGYDVRYHEAPGGHDFATFRRSAVRGLRELLATPLRERTD